MDDFLKFYDQLSDNFPLHLEISKCKITDWSIYIYKKECADLYPNADCFGSDVILVNVQDSDMELCFAKAHVALKEWLLEYRGGY